MIFDLRTGHLGDVLMAMPAMRAGDAVIARPEHRVPGLAVRWLDDGRTTVSQAPRRGRHFTEAWLESTGRSAYRHTLLAPEDRDLAVIAPDVQAPAKRWGRWGDLMVALVAGGRRGVIIITAAATRAVWMQALNRAHTVICPDTGTAHMADALGCPRVVALHGVPANWPHCAPFWSRAHCVARPSMHDITVDAVLEAVNG